MGFQHLIRKILLIALWMYNQSFSCGAVCKAPSFVPAPEYGQIYTQGLVVRLAMFPSVMLMLASFAIFGIIIVGISGNALTIVALLNSPRQRNNIANVFIITLSAMDCLFCILVSPIDALTYYYGTWEFGDSICKIVTLVRYTVVAMSLECITLITINRYIMVAHHNIYDKIYKPVWVAAMLVLGFTISFGKQVPILLEYCGRYAFKQKILMCTIFSETHGGLPKIIIMMIDFFIPCITIIICYCRIFLIIHRSASKVRVHQEINRDMSLRRKKMEISEIIFTEKEWQLTKMCLVTFLAFLMCYFPSIIVILVDKDTEVLELHVWANVILYLSACVNPFIYAATNKQYREAYKSVLDFRRYIFVPSSSGDEASGRRASNDML